MIFIHVDDYIFPNSTSRDAYTYLGYCIIVCALNWVDNPDLGHCEKQTQKQHHWAQCQQDFLNVEGDTVIVIVHHFMFRVYRRDVHFGLHQTGQDGHYHQWPV